MMLPVALVLLLWGALATAQDTLGELLDAGARKLSAEEFRQELVQRVIVGPTLAGGSLELVYTTNGKVQGAGSSRRGLVAFTPVSGEWKIDDNGRICTSMVFFGGSSVGSAENNPTRCQVWFKHDGQYFLSDSDWDRSGKVLRRTVKQ
jgi:hypothetical protein